MFCSLKRTMKSIGEALVQWRYGRMLRDCLRIFGYHNTFEVGGITYRVDASSIGKTPLGEVTANGAIQMIDAMGQKDLKVLDVACGVGIIGLAIYNKFRDRRVVSDIVFSDINIFNLHSLRRVIGMNGFEDLMDKQLRIYLSDSLKHIPRTETFDLIVSNPPDFFIEDRDAVELSSNTLGRYSQNWGFHKSFYQDCHHYLNHKGKVWFLENSDAIGKQDLEAIIGSNRFVCLKEFIPDKVSPGLYWSITEKV